MEFKNLISQAWKFMEFNYWCLSSKIKVSFGRLVTADDKARTM